MLIHHTVPRCPRAVLWLSTLTDRLPNLSWDFSVSLWYLSSGWEQCVVHLNQTSACWVPGQVPHYFPTFQGYLESSVSAKTRERSHRKESLLFSDSYRRSSMYCHWSMAPGNLREEPSSKSLNSWLLSSNRMLLGKLPPSRTLSLSPLHIGMHV